MTYREEEGTILYRLHLLQNSVSSLSSIPHLISPNNLPFSSCPNRESHNLRQYECAEEKERERKITPSHTHSHTPTPSFLTKVGAKQCVVCRSEEAVAGLTCSKVHRVAKSGKREKHFITECFEYFHLMLCFASIPGYFTDYFNSTVFV